MTKPGWARLTVLIGLGVYAAGCDSRPPPGAFCAADADCQSGYCNTATQVCAPAEEKDGGAPDGSTVVTCSPACRSFESCDTSGTCLPVFTGLTIVSPHAGDTVGASVAIEVEIAIGAGLTPTNYPSDIVVSATPTSGSAQAVSLVHGIGPRYAGNWSPTVGKDGTVTFVAQSASAGLTSAAVSVVTDLTKPDLVISIAPPPSRTAAQADPDALYAAAFKRDETATVCISSGELNMVPTSVKLRVFGSNGGAKGAALPDIAVTAGTLPACNCIASWCGYATVDLSKPEMKDFRAHFLVEATALDLAGNKTDFGAAGVIPGDIAVSRWKWVFDKARNGAIRSSPAIGSNGTVFFGSDDFYVYAVKPDGTKLWEFPTSAAIVAAPVVGSGAGAGEAVYVNGTSSGAGVVWQFGAADGVGSPVCTQGTDSLASMALGVTQISGDSVSRETIFTVFNDLNLGTAVLEAVRPGAGGLYRCLGLGSSLANTIVGTGTGLAIKPGAQAVDVYFGDGNGNVQGMSMDGVGTWAKLTGWPVQLGGGNAPANPIVISTGVAGGGGGPGVGMLFTISNGAAPVLSTFNSASPTWNAIQLPSGHVLAGANNGKLVAVPLPASGSVANTLIDLSPGSISGAPVLGSDGELYLTVGGKVAALSTSPVFARVWDFAPGTTSQASPALDCGRDASQTKRAGAPGALYVGGDNGKLYAFITDSRGIDTSAPWPKFHHDPRNTSNPDTALSQFACP